MGETARFTCPAARFQRKTKKKTMPKSDYLKQADELFAEQLTIFKNNIGGYAATLEIDADDITGQAANATYFAYVVASIKTSNPEPMISIHLLRGLRLAALLTSAAVLLPLAPDARAQSYWNVSSGNWHTAGNWSPSGVPTSGSFLAVGDYSAGVATGTASITSANATYNGQVFIGRGPGAAGTVDVLNGRTLTSSERLLVGSGGTGILTIQSSSTVNISSFTLIGSTFGGGFGTTSYYGTGAVTVDSGGKLATSYINMAVAGTSSATLNLNSTSGSRGVVETGYISEGSGSQGGTINFNGGILRATGDQSNFLQNFETGDVQILSEGAFIDSNGYNIGISTALQGSGSLTKQGAGTLTLTGASSYSGNTNVDGGTLNIQSGGTVSNTHGQIGVTGGSSGAATITGSGSQWNNTSELYVGHTGNGTLNLLSGGTVSSAYSFIGYDTASVGSATVNGIGSQWTNTNNLYAGFLGSGTLNVQNGGTVSSSYGTIGRYSSSVGIANITGTGSQWTISNDLEIGTEGSGTLNIQSGGKVTNTRAYIAFSAGVTATASVTGSGSLWSNGGNVEIGHAGTGTLTVDAGGKVTAANITLAASGSGKGTLNLNGTSGSRGMLETSFLSEGSGTQGATINFNGGILRATGTQTDFLRNFETGDVQILAGGAFVDTNGYDVTVTSSLQFQGTGGLTKQGLGKLTLDGTRIYNGTSTVEAGTLSNTSGILGNSAGSTSSMTVTGSGAQWSNSFLYVGVGGNGTLNVLNGGAVSSATVSIGALAGSTGTATVAGPGSQWINSGHLYVAENGNGTLNIQSGGVVSNAGGALGWSSGGTSTATVTGAGSQWTNSVLLYVGHLGNGALTVDAGGTVTAPNINLAFSGNGKGTLNLNGTSGSRGMLETSYLSEGTGTQGGTINFNGGILRATGNQASFLQNFETGDVQLLAGGAFVDTQTFNAGIGVALQGAGGLNKQGAGKLTLSAASTYAGPTTVEAGTLEVTGSISGTVTVQSGGTLSGTGTMQDVTVQGGAKVSPGVSGIGSLHTQGETWNGGGTYVWDLAATTGTPGTSWDFIDAAGALSLAATAGNQFTLDINGSVSGLTFYTSYDWKILTATGGFGVTFAAEKFAFDTTDFSNNTGGSFSVLTSGNDLVLRFSTVPEPGSVGLLLLGVSLLGCKRRRA
jgi:fibronectin-binding autotransporter adhesin